MVVLHKRLFLITLSIGVTLTTVVGCLKVSELYFFDRFYYDKVPELGYVKPISNPLVNAHNPPTIEHRIRDLRLVFSRPTSPVNQKVLGTVDDRTQNQPYKILLIGDSVVYGNGVRESQRMS